MSLNRAVPSPALLPLLMLISEDAAPMCTGTRARQAKHPRGKSHASVEKKK